MTEKKQLEGIKESANARKNGNIPSDTYVELLKGNAEVLYDAQLKTLHEKKK